jgi:hypothetical protein
MSPNAPPFDWRLIVNGYRDRLMYEQGNVDPRLPHRAEMQERMPRRAKTKLYGSPLEKRALQAFVWAPFSFLPFVRGGQVG